MASDDMKYPTDHILGIVKSSASGSAIAALRSQGFLDSEVRTQQGTEDAERLAESSGHGGLWGAILHIADRLGIREDELEEKHTYEEALRAGDTVVLVHAPTEERKQLAAKILTEHGARFVNFLGRFTSERFKP